LIEDRFLAGRLNLGEQFAPIFRRSQASFLRVFSHLGLR
jgi:hypothetical protein